MQRSRDEQIQFDQQVKTEVLLDQVRRRFSSRGENDNSPSALFENRGSGSIAGNTAPVHNDSCNSGTTPAYGPLIAVTGPFSPTSIDTVKRPLSKKLTPLMTGKTTSDQKLEKFLDTIRSTGFHVTKYSGLTKGRVTTNLLLKLDNSGFLYFNSLFHRTKYNLNFLDEVAYRADRLLMAHSFKNDCNANEDMDMTSDCESDTSTIKLDQSANRKFSFSTSNDRMSVGSDRMSSIGDDMNNDDSLDSCVSLWMSDKDRPLRIALFDRKDSGDSADLFFTFDYLKQKLMRMPTFLTDYLQEQRE